VDIWFFSSSFGVGSENNSRLYSVNYGLPVRLWNYCIRNEINIHKQEYQLKEWFETWKTIEIDGKTIEIDGKTIEIDEKQ
jgi:hypothetical protein